MKERCPWSASEIREARRLLAGGLTPIDVDEALGRRAGATADKLRLLDKPGAHERAKANMRRRWRELAAQAGEGARA